MESNVKRITLNIVSGIISILITIMSLFLVITFTINMVYIKTNVKGYSMQPTLNSEVDSITDNGDIVYINRYREYHVGDIVVARLDGKSDPIIKRLTGIEGDTIQIKPDGDNYILYVNEKILYSRPITYVSLHGEVGGSYSYYETYLDYLSSHRGTDRIVANSRGEECIKIGANECFLMGDNWGETTDSISYGSVHVNSIIGVVDIVIPLGENQFKTLFRELWDILT